MAETTNKLAVPDFLFDFNMVLSATVWPLKLLPVSAKPDIASASVVPVETRYMAQEIAKKW